MHITLFGFQPLLLFILAGFGWGVNLQVLRRKGIDALRILGVTSPILRANPDSNTDGGDRTSRKLSSYNKKAATYHKKVYFLCLVLAAIATMGYMWTTLMNDLVKPMDQNPFHAFCVGIIYMIVLVILIMPARYLFPSIRFAFLR